MRRLLQLCTLLVAGVIFTPSTSEAGPLRRAFGGERSKSVAVSRTRTFSLGGSHGCANGQCARPSAAASSAAVAPAPKAPAPKKKTP